MSIEQAQAFIEKVKNDEDLATRLKEAEDSESRLNIAKEMGYEFSPEEARQANEQLTHEHLENLAAGQLPYDNIVIPPMQCRLSYDSTIVVL